MCIIRDIERHDKVCSRKAGHGKHMPEVTHSCKVQRKECNDPFISYESFNANEISYHQNLVQKTTSSIDDKQQSNKILKKYGFC